MKGKLLISLGIAFLAGLGPQAAAATLSVFEIAQRAAENSHLVKAQSDTLEASRLEEKTSGILPNPTVNLQLGGTRQGESEGSTIETSVVQTLPFPGKLGVREQLRRIQTRLTKASSEEAKVLVFHEAALLAFQWVVMNEQSKHFEERQKRFRLLGTFLKTHPDGSPSQKIDKVLIDNQTRLIEKGFAELDVRKKSIELELESLIQTESPIEPRPEWIDPASAPRRADLEPFRSQSPRLVRKRIEVEQKAEQVRREKLSILPDINLGAGYRLESVVPRNQFYYGSLSIVLPIFDRGQYSIAAARAQLDAEQARESLLKSQFARDLDRAWLELGAALKIAASFPLSDIEGIEAQFAQVEDAFRKNRISTTKYLQTDSQFHESIVAMYDAQMSLAQKLSQVYLLYGKPLQWK